MLFIRQGATHKVVVGPAVAVGDGFTPVTNLAVSSADEAEAILHDNGTVVDIAAYTFAAITTADGYYHLTLQSGISGTVGHMTIAINDDSLILPLRQDFTVLEEAAYDAMYAASAPGPLLASSNGSGLTEAGGTGDQLTALATAANLATVAGYLDTEIAEILADTGTDGVVLSEATCNKIADHILRRSLATALASGDGDVKGFRSLAGAVAKLVNKLAVSGSDLKIYETDDTTELGSQAITTDDTAEPITALDTA